MLSGWRASAYRVAHLESIPDALRRSYCSSSENQKISSFGRFSPFVDTPGKTLNLLKAYTFYYANPHPEITPHLFLTNTLFNELGSIGLLSYQMRCYPHRILDWTHILLKALPSFTEAELNVIDPKSKSKLEEAHSDPLSFLIKRRKNLIASTLYSVRDFSAARFASEIKEFEGIDFDPATLPFGSFLEAATSDHIDNPICFHDTPKALISQYLRILKFPTEDLVRSSFPLSYWNMWWGLFYLTGDTASVLAVVTTLIYSIQQLTTNAYQHSMVYGALTRLQAENKNCGWLQLVLDDVDKMNHNHGPFTLQSYQRKEAYSIPSSGLPLILEHFPNMQISLDTLIPPIPFSVFHQNDKEIIKQGEKRGFLSPDGSIDEEVVVETLAMLFQKHDDKVELSGKEEQEEITETHELLFHVLELYAGSRNVTNISLLHCLAKLCVLMYEAERPEGFIGGVVSKEKKNVKAVYWYNRLLDLQPKEPLLNYELGILLKQIGDFRGSMGLLEKSLRLDYQDVATPLTEVMEKLGITTPYDDDE